jgi:hypothetical protein
MFGRLLARIASALARRKIPYMVIGGQAVLRYGEPRATKDIDITLGIGIEGLPSIKRIIDSLGLIYLVENPDEFARATMVVPAAEPASGVRVDFILSFSPYERQALRRTCPVKLEGTVVRFASLEDVVIHKIIAGRPRDIEDIESILLKNPAFDAAYIKKWLREFEKTVGENLLGRFADARKILKKKASA